MTRASSGFPTDLLPVICCTACGAALSSKVDEQYAWEGDAYCTKCGVAYPISEGVLMMLAQGQLQGIQAIERESRDKAAGGYDRRLAARYAKEVPSTLNALGNLKGKRVIEYAAGTGRITSEYVSQVETLIATDFSLASLRILQNKLNGAHVGLICADATALRTKEDYFDVALASQFYEHLPDDAARNAFLSNCTLTLKVGGRFVSTTYHFDLRMRIKQKPQEGTHPTGIFYHYYTMSELRSEFGKYLHLERVFPIDITLPLESRMSLSAKAGGAISRFFEHVPFMRDFGHLVLVIARK